MKRILTTLVLFMIVLCMSSCKRNDTTIENTYLTETKTYITTQTIERMNQNLVDSDFVIDKYDILDIPFIYMEKLYRLNNYKRVVKGETVAKKIITYTQVIDDEFINKEDEKHLITRSKSSLVNVYLEAFFLSDRVSYREKETDEFIESSYMDYENVYGTFPFDCAIEGFELTKESLISIDRIDGDSYKYLLVIDGNSCSTRLKKQMKKMGDLKEEPVFNNVEIILSLNIDFSPITVEFKATYSINKAIVGKTNCVQNYTATYTYFE